MPSQERVEGSAVRILRPLPEDPPMYLEAFHLQIVHDLPQGGLPPVVGQAPLPSLKNPNSLLPAPLPPSSKRPKNL